MPLFGSLSVQYPLILASLGFGVLGAAALVPRLVRNWRDEAEIKPVLPKTQYITQDTEDSLQLNTLDTLLGHYNPLIRETAAKIICDRAANDGVSIELLLVGITNPDYEERIKNLHALALIIDFNSLKKLHCWKAYTALVRSLELSLDPNQPPLDDEDWDEYQLRDMSEKLCLMFIGQLVQHHKSNLLIKAKFVERWLAKQNWGPEEKREHNFRKYMQTKNNRITHIVRSFWETTEGQEALENAGLIRLTSYREGPDDDPGIIRHVSDQFRLMLSLRGGRARSVEQSPEEQRLRHRNREAMVLNDGNHPFNSDDIFQRELDPGSPP
ncbi:hypothetical protein V8F20_001589 [Naviculisporaceae sp. PSN 640]